jgi:hypothetical protein
MSHHYAHNVQRFRWFGMLLALLVTLGTAGCDLELSANVPLGSHTVHVAYRSPGNARTASQP